MVVATWNVNSIRKRLPLILDWLAEHRPDIMCLQETKVPDAEFPAAAFRAAGYHSRFRGMKAYNGVATLSRTEPEFVRYGLQDGPDSEDVRALETVIRGLPVMNTYVPQGFRVGSEKYLFKLGWLRRIRTYFGQRHDPGLPLLWVGDMNVAPEAIDVYHPDRRVNDVDFHIDARNAYAEVLSWGFVDLFRKLNPERIQYTYWDYFRNAFQNNWGWRIDHILGTAPLAAACRKCDVDTAPRAAPGASDHTVVWTEFDWPGVWVSAGPGTPSLRP